MKVQLLLIGAVGVLSLGAMTLAGSVPLAHTSPGTPTSSVSPSPEPSETPEASPSPESSPEPADTPEAAATAHPCNHGFYVSEAAHGHKGGAYTAQIGHSDLGKNGDCSAPLPSPLATSTHHAEGTDGTDQEHDSGS